ncbi:hypothetical protein KIN20_035692 [Parelaphostrongylus tenuis]|uniref:Uncharacterized protein n=1 Tax=Parelaphostrongylus tenuis TaxID=148309 RepID=A0AAD5RC36_PARTN|nr:hypothetical protein KIN20_035692 [Parelaphostrongylus tenuis]
MEKVTIATKRVMVCHCESTLKGKLQADTVLKNVYSDHTEKKGDHDRPLVTNEEGLGHHK